MPTQHASNPYPVAQAVTDLLFRFEPSSLVDIEVRFYSDLAGTVDVPGGSRVVTVSRVSSLDSDDIEDERLSVSEISANLATLTAGTPRTFGLGAGASIIELSATGGVNPPGAVTYRVIVNAGLISGPVGQLGFAVTIDTSIDVPRGQGIHPAFGTRANIPNSSTVDVWEGVAAKRPLPLAPKPMFVVSSSAGDTFGVGGAQLVLVSFIDENGDWRNSDLLVMQGLTQVPITYKPADGLLGNTSKPPAGPTPPDGSSQVASIFRVQDMTVVDAAGATEASPVVNNVGDIRVRDGGGVVFERIPIGAGRSRSAAFHCPRGYTARLTYAPLGTARGQGTAFIAANFGLGTAWNVVPVAAVDGTTALFAPDPATTPVAERADVQAIVQTASNSIDVSFILQFRLVPNL